MKTSVKHIVLWLSGILLVQLTAFGTDPKGIDFFKGTWREALEKAQAENKPIFVDFYASWCGPCKQMAKEVFTDVEVGNYFNVSLISIQINAEEQEADLVNEMKLEAYPTLAIFDPAGNVLSRQVGAMQKPQLLEFVKSSTDYKTIKEAFMAEPDNFERINAYLAAQQYKDKEKLDSISTAILNTLSGEQLQTLEAWNILVKYSSDYNSKAFEFVTQNAQWYLLHTPEKEEFQNGYSWFINAMIDKAAETEDLSLLEKATSDFLTMRRSCGTLNKPEVYFREALQLRYLAIRDDSTYRQRIITFVQTYHRNEWKKLAANALYILNSDPTDMPTRQAAVKMARKALALNNNAYTNWAAAIANQKEQKPAEAKQLVMLAFQKARQDQLVIDGTGTVTLDLKELEDTVISIPLRVN